MKKDSKGLNAYTVEYLGRDVRQSSEVFASTLKQALIQSHDSLQKKFGWEFVIISVEPKP